MTYTFTKLIPAVVAGLLLISSCDNDRPETTDDERNIPTEEEVEQAPRYDSLRAAKYGADDYGMRKYVMAFLKAGPNREQDSVKAAELQAAHMQNIQRLAEEGKLIMAGPFFGDGELRGIYLFDTQSLAEAEALTNTD
ncbi:MAG: YciI family protein, partial [Cyclobacteriaceae bacterium]